MSIMESSWYLDSEKLSYINYPEVSTLTADIANIEIYAKRVAIALNNYNKGTYNKIDVNVVDLQAYIALCRNVTGILGRADNICFDILLDLRTMQQLFQSIMFTYNMYGSQYVGTPTTSS